MGASQGRWRRKCYFYDVKKAWVCSEILAPTRSLYQLGPHSSHRRQIMRDFDFARNWRPPSECGKSQNEESDEEVEEAQVQVPFRPTKIQQAPATTNQKGRYSAVASFAAHSNTRTQTSIVSAFARQSQNTFNSTRTSSRNVGKKSSILYDSDSD